MPVYLHCPHCEHPQIVSPRRRGRTLFCRQCGRAYLTSKDETAVWPLSISSISELVTRQKANRDRVFVLDA